MGEKDITQKNFEAYNDVFSDIVNGTLFGGRQLIKPDRLTDAVAKSQYKADDSTVHEQERDVAKYWLDENCYIRLALIGVENQLAIEQDMPLRVIGYDGSSYRDELNHDETITDEATGKKHKIRKERYPVITIVLYFGKTPWKKPLSLYDVLDISDDLKPFVNDYKINLIDVPRLSTEQVDKFTGDFQIIADYFVQLNQKKDYTPNKQVIRHTDSLLKLLAVLTADERYAKVYEEISYKGDDVTMCEVLDKAEARGEARGKIKSVAEILKRIIAKNNWSKEQAMEFIGIPENEFAKYAALL